MFSRSQVFQLESTFDLKRYLSSSERAGLAASLNLTETQVRSFFVPHLFLILEIDHFLYVQVFSIFYRSSFGIVPIFHCIPRVHLEQYRVAWINYRFILASTILHSFTVVDPFFFLFLIL